MIDYSTIDEKVTFLTVQCTHLLGKITSLTIYFCPLTIIQLSRFPKSF